MAGGINQRAGDGDEMDEAHEINVTPFIDVMLVLLIIFMVAAPLATVDVNVDLPASTATAQPRPQKPLFLTLRRDLTLGLGEETVPREALGTALEAASDGDRDARVFVRADRIVDYGDLMALMNDLRSAGYLKVALVGLETTAADASPRDGGAAGQQAAGVPAPNAAAEAAPDDGVRDAAR